jgi:hypothetical protein
MPKPSDYSKCQIYKIVCKDLSIKDIYVGHTCNWVVRKAAHKRSVEKEDNDEYNGRKAKIIREHGGWQNWQMVLIENYPCKNKLEAAAKEREWLEKLSAKMNVNVPIVTKEETKEKSKQIQTCGCGLDFSKSNKWQHAHSKHHQDWVKSADQKFADRLEQEMNDLVAKNDVENIIIELI